MCNKLHDDFLPIKKEGFGYKMVSIEEGYGFCPDMIKPPCKGFKYYPDTEGWIERRALPRYENCYQWDGFCFFLNKKTAEKGLRNWVKETKGAYAKGTKVTIKKIEYREGLGKQTECDFIHKPIEIALCKEFKFVEE